MSMSSKLCGVQWDGGPREIAIMDLDLVGPNGKIGGRREEMKGIMGSNVSAL